MASSLLPFSSPGVLLIDTHAFVPPEEFRVDQEEVSRIWAANNTYTQEERDFQERVYVKSGLSRTGTYLPPAIHPRFCGDKPSASLTDAATEAKMCLFGALEGLLAKTGLQPTDIDILVTTCSIYCPTPSMASMVINHFKMRSNIHSYSLGGMGCANGVVSVNLIRDMLKAHPNANAVLLTTETTTPAYYPGRDKHRMVTNLIFRMGASAVLFSNKESWMGRAKYALKAAHRVHVGQSEEAYTAIHYSPDEQGLLGVYLGKNVVTEASRALTKAMWAAGPAVLTARQKIEFCSNWLRRRVLGPHAAPPFTPKFSGTVQHFLLHAGGAKVLDGLGKALALTEYDLEPSRAVLCDYGNVSSSTTWYTLGFVETMRGVKRGDTVLQVGVGSGIKCGVNVWKALRTLKEPHHAWEHRLPEPERAAAAQQRARRVAVQMEGSRQYLALARLAVLAVLLALVFAMMRSSPLLAQLAGSEAEL